ncbi:CRM-domain containing factor CFM9, mitochondrial isoform X2 [Henckelia pumila]|uniref:CRM-domain containing factor CFM9, mitochondrial isoform X2 n=1 Tax=Henckelia pumila TaxID=405737 RepID=UPI003C6E5E13
MLLKLLLDVNLLNVVAKKKVALLLQKLKKYELPELPPPRHDPELLTSEHLQAYKKIGFRNRNYVPVGVRGVFGGVVQNMHLHWKFHETVQVCCDNFPKEKIKEMATMLARLSGGIVVNIHNVKTIIMFRGRNYRQPKNLIPINTLTKRKALFKARFEQALESQKLNIKKIEQDLRRKGVNPDDPVAMASIQRVASTFFNAIDKREGSPYIFREDKSTQIETDNLQQPQDAGDDSDQEELDRFIAEIEDAADQEWAAEEAAEKEELGRFRYWNRDDFGKFRRDDVNGGEDSEDENRVRTRNWNQTRRRTSVDSESEEGNDSELDHEWDSNDDVNRGGDGEDSEEDLDKLPWNKLARRKDIKIGEANSKGFKRNEIGSRGRTKDASMSEDMLSDLDDAMWGSDEEEEQNLTNSRTSINSYQSGTSDDENYDQFKREDKRNSKRGLNRSSAATEEDHSTAKYLSSDSDIGKWESDAPSGDESYRSSSDSDGWK